MNRGPLILGSLALLNLLTYLFVTAPEPLAEGRSAAVETLPIEAALGALNAENAAVRALYTQEIVGQGQKRSLLFSERWKEPNVQAGPLPALFLREIGAHLERNRLHIGLYLGSDAPISAANRFEGGELEALLEIRKDRKPRFFYSADLARHTAMFPDVAVSAACVSCHNEHPDSPRTDWRLNDVMGATTWTYPAEAVSTEELIEMISAFRGAVAASYAAYLEKARHFDDPPVIGHRWPRDGNYLPSLEVWMEAVRQRVSSSTLDVLLRGRERPSPQVAENTGPTRK